MPHKKKNSKRYTLVSVGLMLGFAMAIATHNAISTPRGEYALLQGTDLHTNTIPRKFQASITQSSGNVAIKASELRRIEILPKSPKDLRVFTGESLRLTSVGIFSSGTANIKADWFIKDGNTMTAIPNCSNNSQCSYTAPSTAGNVHVSAIAHTKKDSVKLTTVSPFAAKGFTDTLPDWASKPIVSLHDLGIITGYEDGRFGPADNLNKGQWITLLYRTLVEKKIIQSSTQCTQLTPNVPSNHYAYSALCAFHERNWEVGHSFEPDLPISRAQAAAITNRVLGTSLMKSFELSQGQILSQGQLFTDITTNNPYYFDTGVMHSVGIMTGNPDGSFGANIILNRAEAATVLYRMYNVLLEKRIISLL